LEQTDVLHNHPLSFIVSIFSHKAAFIGVFDGHAGSRASNFAKENLSKNMLERFPKGIYYNNIFHSLIVILFLPILARDLTAIAGLKPKHVSENDHAHSLPCIECSLIFMTSSFMNVSNILEMINRTQDPKNVN